jgi:hypothetical protein
VLKPASLSFGPQAKGTTSTPHSVTITNKNAAPVLMGDISATDDFIVSSNNCPTTLGPQQDCTIQIEFSPDETATISGNILISDSDPDSPQTLNVSGKGQ